MRFRVSRAHAVRLFAATTAVAAVTLGVVPTVTASAAGSSAPGKAAAGVSGNDAQAEANKRLVLYFQDQPWNDGNLSAIDQYVSPNYIQHNPTLGNGGDALRQLMSGLRSAFPQLHITNVRAVAQGDLVVLQNNTGSASAPGDIIFDMYRVDGGKIDEHWDAIESVPTTTTSGNDMFSQPSTPANDSAPAAVTAQDEDLVENYVTALMQDHDLSAVSRYVVSSLYQHDPTLANGSAALTAYYSSLLARYPSFNVQIAQVVADGDLVAVHVHVRDAPQDLGQAVTYLFRVRHGKIVEQWDSAQNVPATSANDNTMF